MLAQDIDFYEVFKISPTAMALFTPDLEIIDANEAALQVVGRDLEEVIGRNLFEVVPKMPDAEGNPRWSALEEAVASGRPQVDRLHRGDVEDPAAPGVFQERWWCTSVRPVRGLDGHVEVLEWSAREVTSIIEQFRSIEREYHHNA